MRKELETLIENITNPAIMTDAQLDILHVNDPTRKLFPPCANPSGLRNLFPSTDWEYVCKNVQAGLPCDLSDPLLTSIGWRLTLTPFSGEEDDRLVMGVFTPLSPPKEQSELHQSVATFSHIYRQPLSNIFGLLSVVRQTLASRADDSLDRYLDDISKDCYRMLRDLGSFTDIYKFSAGLPMRSQVFDIWEVIRSACESVGVCIRKLDIPLEWELPTSPAYVLGDPTLVTMAFSHLMSNSCQFTRESNSISVNGKVKNGKAVITVTDHGIGIPAELQGRVFDIFFSHCPDEAPGSNAGLGLTFVHYLTNAMGGAIALQSEDMEGTTVVLSLPLTTQKPEVSSCFDTAMLLSDRFSPIHVGLSKIF